MSEMRQTQTMRGSFTRRRIDIEVNLIWLRLAASPALTVPHH
jgi:hypothetical protein